MSRRVNYFSPATGLGEHADGRLLGLTLLVLCALLAVLLWLHEPPPPTTDEIQSHKAVPAVSPGTLPDKPSGR